MKHVREAKIWLGGGESDKSFPLKRAKCKNIEQGSNVYVGIQHSERGQRNHWATVGKGYRSVPVLIERERERQGWRLCEGGTRAEEGQQSEHRNDRQRERSKKAHPCHLRATVAHLYAIAWV